MPTPITIQIPSPIAPLATPEVLLPCGVKVPSIPLIPSLNLSITLPSFPPTKSVKKGPKKTRTSKFAAKLIKLANFCNSILKEPRS